MWYYYLLMGILAIGVLADGLKRKAKVIPWAIGTVFLGPFLLPVYLAKRPLKAGEVREGGTAWNILKNFAVVWTILMVTLGLWYMMTASQIVTKQRSDAELVGASLGMTLGLGMITMFWFFPVVGAVALGFMLKNSSIVEKGPTGPLASVALQSEHAPAGPKKPIGSTQGLGRKCPQCGLMQMPRPTCKACGAALGG